jgi:hypothetical protein
MAKVVQLSIFIHFDATCKTTRATLIHGRASTRAAISRDVCDLPNNNYDNNYWDFSNITTTQLLEIPENTIQSSNAISKKMHSVASRTTQVIFNHEGRM